MPTKLAFLLPAGQPCLPVSPPIYSMSRTMIGKSNSCAAENRMETRLPAAIYTRSLTSPPAAETCTHVTRCDKRGWREQRVGAQPQGHSSELPTHLLSTFNYKGPFMKHAFEARRHSYLKSCVFAAALTMIGVCLPQGLAAQSSHGGKNMFTIRNVSECEVSISVANTDGSISLAFQLAPGVLLQPGEVSAGPERMLVPKMFNADFPKGTYKVTISTAKTKKTDVALPDSLYRVVLHAADVCPDKVPTAPSSKSEHQ